MAGICVFVFILLDTWREICYNTCMKDVNLVIGNNIKELRKANKLTQYELASRLNYSNKAISRWESGEVVPDIQTLNKLCEIFNIPLAKIFDENITTKKIRRTYKLQIGNKLTISLLAVLLVWFASTIAFVYIGLNTGRYIWQVFVWSIPASCVVGIVFNSIWGKASFNFILISILCWTSLTCVYLLFYDYHIWPIFLIGIPMQVGIVLWSNISSNNQKKQ